MDNPTRRDLVAGVVIAGAAAACRDRKEPQPAAKPTSGEAPPAGSATPTPTTSGTQALPAPELEELSIAQLLERLASKSETAVSLVDKYRKRIEATNERGPKLRAVLELDTEATKQAEDADRARAAGKTGRLLGIPILVKDNIDTAGGTTTTAGSLALEG